MLEYGAHTGRSVDDVHYQRKLDDKSVNGGTFPFKRFDWGPGYAILKAILTHLGSANLLDESADEAKFDLELRDERGLKYEVFLHGKQKANRTRLTWRLKGLQPWMSAFNVTAGDEVDLVCSANGMLSIRVLQQSQEAQVAGTSAPSLVHSGGKQSVGPGLGGCGPGGGGDGSTGGVRAGQGSVKIRIGSSALNNDDLYLPRGAVNRFFKEPNSCHGKSVVVVDEVDGESYNSRVRIYGEYGYRSWHLVGLRTLFKSKWQSRAGDEVLATMSEDGGRLSLRLVRRDANQVEVVERGGSSGGSDGSHSSNGSGRDEAGDDDASDLEGAAGSSQGGTSASGDEEDGSSSSSGEDDGDENSGASGDAAWEAAASGSVPTRRRSVAQAAAAGPATSRGVGKARRPPRPGPPDFDSGASKTLRRTDVKKLTQIVVPVRMYGQGGVFASLIPDRTQVNLTLHGQGGPWTGKLSYNAAKDRALVSGIRSLMVGLNVQEADVLVFTPMADSDTAFWVTLWRPYGSQGGELSRVTAAPPASCADAGCVRGSDAAGDAPLADRLPAARAAEQEQDGAAGGSGAPSPRGGGGLAASQPAATGHRIRATTAGAAAEVPAAAGGAPQHTPVRVKEEAAAAAGPVGAAGTAPASGGHGCLPGAGVSGEATGLPGPQNRSWRPASAPTAAAGAPAAAATAAAAPSAGEAAVPAHQATAAAARSGPLPAASIAHLHGCLPAGVAPPALQPGELRLCGYTFHPLLRGAVERRMREWEAGQGRELEQVDVVNLQICILGVTKEGQPAYPHAMAPWVSAFQRHGLRSHLLRSKLARLLGIGGEARNDAPLPAEVKVAKGMRPCLDRARGGRGLEAAEPIRKNTVLGVLGGYVLPSGARGELLGFRGCSEAAKAELRRRVAAAGVAGAASIAWDFLTHSFTMPYTWGDEQQAGAGTAAAPAASCSSGAGGAMPAAQLCTLGYGNELALTNDPRALPPSWYEDNSIAAADVEGAANCLVLPMTVRGLVLLALVALRDIAPGEQLLRDYGADWWCGMAGPWEILVDEGLDPEHVLRGSSGATQPGDRGDSAAAQKLVACADGSGHGQAQTAAPEACTVYPDAPPASTVAGPGSSPQARGAVGGHAMEASTQGRVPLSSEPPVAAPALGSPAAAGPAAGGCLAESPGRGSCSPGVVRPDQARRRVEDWPLRAGHERSVEREREEEEERERGRRRSRGREAQRDEWEREQDRRRERGREREGEGRRERERERGRDWEPDRDRARERERSRGRDREHAREREWERERERGPRRERVVRDYEELEEQRGAGRRAWRAEPDASAGNHRERAAAARGYAGGDYAAGLAPPRDAVRPDMAPWRADTRGCGPSGAGADVYGSDFDPPPYVCVPHAPRGPHALGPDSPALAPPRQQRPAGYVFGPVPCWRDLEPAAAPGAVRGVPDRHVPPPEMTWRSLVPHMPWADRPR